MLMIDQLKTDYINWLKEKIVFTELEKAIEIATPFLNSNQDYVHIYAIKKDDEFILTDDGDTLNELYLGGLDLNTPKRKELLDNIIRLYGVSLSEKGELFTQATIDQFPNKKHALLQAMLKVNDLLYLNRRTVKNVFTEDVKKFLWDNDIRFTHNLGLTGVSGYHQYIDFVIPPSRKAGERFIQTINNLDRNKVQSTLFLWDDIKPVRGSNASLYVFVNDAYKQVRNEDITALKKYEVKVVMWERRKSVIKELSA